MWSPEQTVDADIAGGRDDLLRIEMGEGEQMPKGNEVPVLVLTVLAVSIAVDVAARYLLIIPIPWYATTALLTLYFVAHWRSNEAAADAAIVERFNKIEDDVGETRKRVEALVTSAKTDTRYDELRRDLRWLDQEVRELKRLVN